MSLKIVSKKIKKCISLLFIKTFGWKITGTVPQDMKKLVMIGAPHTSNFDFPLMMCCAWYYGLDVKWLGKESLFSNKIIRYFATALGGVKVDRTRSDQTVSKIASALKQYKNRICLVVAPEGTRSKKPGWHSGFFHIARTAQLPLALGFIDYPKKVMGVGPILKDLSDLNQTMQTIQNFYKEISGKNPKQKSPIQIIKNY